MEPTVLMYNLSPASRTQVELLCRELGAAARNVEKPRQGLTLGALVGLLPEVPGGSQVPGEMLVMAYFDRDMLDDFLRGCRARQIPPIPHKAMLTLTNTAWTGRELYESISREMAAMQANRGWVQS